MNIEALRNTFIFREVQRLLDRRARRMPCTVDSYDPSQHTVKVKLQPEGTPTGWLQIETAQIGLQIAPNIGDPGWLEFHEADLRAAVYVGSNHNDQNPPPAEIQAGEWRYQDKSGSSLYFKSDGSITATDKAGSTVVLKGDDTASITASGGLTINADVTVNGAVTATGDVKGGSISLEDHVHGGVQGGSADTGPPIG